MDTNLLMEAVNKNLEQVPQELKQLKTGDEISFYHSLQDKKIIYSSLDELKNVLKFVMIKIGLRSDNWPSDEEKGVLIDHIIKEYGGHTCKEIKLAFEMAIAGKLTEYNSKGNLVTVDAKCYENFSCLYFSQIMNAYRIWAQETYKMVAQKPIVGVENKKEMTDSDMENWVKETSLVATEISKLFLIPIEIYEWLLKMKKLKVSKDEREEILKQAINIREQQLSDSIGRDAEKELSEFIYMKKKGEFKDKEALVIKNISKRIAVLNYFKNDSNK